MGHFRRWLLAVYAFAALAAVAPAQADIFATFDKGTEGPELVGEINATTGAPVSLPPGVDDPNAGEFHLSLSPNGRYLVFQRVAAGSVRIVMVERSTGRSADLFNAFEAAADPPYTPTFSLDGTKVLTGRRLDRRDPSAPAGALQSAFTETDVTGFPTGPFPHRIVLAGGADSTAAGRTLQPATFGSNLLAFGVEYASGGPPGRITVQGATGATTLSDPARRSANPTVSQLFGVVVFESSPATSPFQTKLAFRPLSGIATAPTTELPALVNARDRTLDNPAFTPDGRYLAFIRRDSRGSARLFVWDTQTQLLLNPNGFSVAGPGFFDGALALEVRRVFTNTTLSGGTAGFSLASASTTGLLVQRIVGRHRVLGRRAPKLKRVGRVPLGRFHKGRHRKRWRFTVHGHRLRRGCYLVTFRALTRKRKVRDLSQPFTVRVRKHRRPLVRRGVRLRTCGRAKR
jgi:WD40-like Beta Propeller Repeat